MKTKKVIKSKNLPTKLPAVSSVLCYLSLDYWHAPQWLWGALGLFFLIYWVGSISLMIRQEEIDLFNKDQQKL